MDLDRRTRIDIALLAVVLLIGLMLLAGCGGNNDDDEVHPQANCHANPEVCK